jgi:hypothetical protein
MQVIMTLDEVDRLLHTGHGLTQRRTCMAAMVRKIGPKVIGLATLAGLFLAGGGSVNMR